MPAYDEAAVRAATHVLTGRRVAEVRGPKGWDHLALATGRARPAPAGKDAGGATLVVPELLPLTEIRAEFSLTWESIRAAERYGVDLDTGPVEQAARDVALAEERLVYQGGPGTPGLLGAKGSPAVPARDWGKAGQAVTDLLAAVERLDAAGVGGPYAAVVDADRYFAYQGATAEGGAYPAAKLLGGTVREVFRSPVLQGGAVLSLRGGDAVITLGGDLTVRYRWHDGASVHFICVETVAVQLLTAEAVCVLRGR